MDSNGAPRFAPVGSIYHYWNMFNEGVLGDYHLLLAHAVLSEADEWHALYQAVRADGTDPFVIMDNSLIELGKPLDTTALIEACAIVGASCVVLADNLQDMQTTMTESYRMISDLYVAGSKVPTLGVAQGASREELMQCVDFFSVEDVDFVSVPRVVADTLGSRIPILKDIALDYDFPIHLLGFSDNMEDDFKAARMSQVMGIDSAVPIRMGLAGLEFEFDSPLGRRHPKYLDSREYTPQVTENLRIVRELLSDTPTN